MWKFLCFGLGCIVGMLVAMGAFVALIGRIESAGELDELVVYDVIIGGMFAFAILLLGMPLLRKNTTRSYVVALLAAGAVWLIVSGSLIWVQDEQFLVHSNYRVSTQP
jgi:hypothetical protein